MQIPSEAFEAVGYCLLSVKSINNKFSICEFANVHCCSNHKDSVGMTPLQQD